MVVVVDEELDALLGELFARPVVIFAALHQLVIAGVEVCGLAEVLRAHLRVVRNHRVDGLLIDGADVADSFSFPVVQIRPLLKASACPQR